MKILMSPWSYGAEICELTGSYLLHQLSNIFDKESVGLYRDDGLGVLKSLSGPEMERYYKEKSYYKVVQRLWSQNNNSS